MLEGTALRTLQIGPENSMELQFDLQRSVHLEKMNNLEGEDSARTKLYSQICWTFGTWSCQIPLPNPAQPEGFGNPSHCFVI